VVPSVETVAAEVEAAIAGRQPPILLVRPGEKWDCFAASDVALAASGTVALELAVAKLPMVIAYKVAPITARIVRAVLTVKYASLLNLQLDRMVVPEFLQEECTPEKLANAASALIIPGDEREQQLAGAAEALALLGVDGESPSRRAAREALSMIQERTQ
jgi:lipid-A-disaccharide synthase